MKYCFVVVVAALFSVASAASLDWRIVGGQTAEDGQFPYQVSLNLFGRHACGGSILNENYVLTAAHCVHKLFGQIYKVHVGSNKLSSPQKIYKVERVIRHEKYDDNKFPYDIGLVKLTEPIQFNDKVQPIQLETSFLDAGVDLVVSGWGKTSFPGSVPNDLQYVHLKSLTTEDCNRRINSTFTVDDTQICTLTREGQGVCKGDSGGPLVHNGKLAGVVSFGYPCALGLPDGFTRVSAYIDWINKHME